MLPQGADRFPAVLAERWTTVKPDDEHVHAVYDIGAGFGVLTHCGLAGPTQVKPGTIDCPDCLAAVARAAAPQRARDYD